MKRARSFNRIFSVFLFLLTAFCFRAGAVPVVSNLGDQWTSGGIGDIHALFRGGTPNGSDTARFTTGAGVYSLNSITLEFEFSSVYESGLPPAPQSVNIQLFYGSTLLGTLAHPVADPTPTQWPEAPDHAYTLFIDFTPTSPIDLGPNAQLSLVISVPAGAPSGAALLFTRSSDYASADGWLMGPTSAGESSAGGEHLKLAVDATAVPDQANTATLLSIGLVVLFWGQRKLGRSKAVI